MGELDEMLARGRAVFIEKTGVSRETLADLDIYAGLLVQWQKSFNLVGPATLPDLWTRHFFDSWQLLQLAPAARRWVDLGSGAGFPGAVIAIAMRQEFNGHQDSGAHVTMIESNGKKAAFLQTVTRETRAPTTIVRDRIENVLTRVGVVDVVTARAVAPLRQLLDWSAPLLKTGASALFSKGRDIDKELVDAAHYWDMDYTIIPSLVESGSVIVKITAVTPVKRSFSE